MPERPLLTAAWRNLLLLNFPVPTNTIKRLAPPGTEPDLHNGQSYISIVGFSFQNVRLFGVPFPGHTSFPEINLRYYVRRRLNNEVRRGVVFAREIVPRRAVALVANHFYNESYITRPMRTNIQIAGAELAPNDTLAYAWNTHPRRLRLSAKSTPWNHLTARVAAPLAFPAPNSLEEFIVEHYWGYTHDRDGRTHDYRVAHNPWRTAPADNVTWNCDVAATYGNSPLAEFLISPPTSALIAEGSRIQLFRGHLC
jgi:uncharacterized protein YqjF (DUF2071 family)